MIYSLHTTGLKAAGSYREETGATQSPNQPVRQKLYGDTRENKSSTFHSFIINLPSLLCRDVLLLSTPCFGSGPAPATPTKMRDGDPEHPARAELLHQAGGAILAVHSQAQLLPASTDSPGSITLYFMCTKVIK